MNEQLATLGALVAPLDVDAQEPQQSENRPKTGSKIAFFISILTFHMNKIVMGGAFI